MPVNLDDYAETIRDADTLAKRRAALIHQLGWLADEAAALGPLLAALPAWAVEQAPLPTDLTAKQTFAALAALDRATYPAWLDSLAADGAPPTLSRPDPLPGLDTADRPLDALLQDIRDARAALEARVAALDADAWDRPAVLLGLAADGDAVATDLYGVVLDIVRYDADRLKELAYRMHEADLRPPTPAPARRDADTSELPRKPE